MSMRADRVVRFICTDGGMHPRTVLETLAPWGDGVRRVRHGAVIEELDRIAVDRVLDHHRAQDGQSQLPAFVWRCGKCPRNPRRGEQEMRRIVDAVLQLRAGAVVECDVSERPWSTLF